MGSGTTLFLSLVLLFAFFGFLSYQELRFDQDIGGHMERAASANTIPIAIEEMKIVVKNMEARGYTEGTTSIVYSWRTPDEDIGFWYQNMKASLTELEAVPPNADQYTTSNVLMKLERTLEARSGEGSKIVVPPGITRYPNNLIYGIVFWVLLIICMVSALFWTSNN